MNIPKEAIQKAIQGGYGTRFTSPEEIMASHSNYQLALSVPFWQALGKILGWPTIRSIEGQAWQRNAHRFYDLILQGQSTEEFWDKLLGV